MPVVDIKGVGKAQFPDNMPREQIRNFLVEKYSKPLQLSKMPNMAAPVEKTLIEKAGQKLSDFLYDNQIVSDRYGAQRIGGNVSALGEFLPVIGDVAAADEFGRAAAEGDKLGMGLASLGVIPIAGDVAKQALRKTKSINLPSGRLGSDQFKSIKQIDPKAVTKPNPDGTVNVTYKEEYNPKKIKGHLYEFEPDALELSEDTFKNVDTYKGDKNEAITVTKQDGDYIILDGHHRAKLAKQEGRNVKAVVIPIDDVAKMKKDNIHQADMREEWVARGLHDKPKSVAGDGNSIHEFGYDPQ